MQQEKSDPTAVPGLEALKNASEYFICRQTCRVAAWGPASGAQPRTTLRTGHSCCDAASRLLVGACWDPTTPWINHWTAWYRMAMKGMSVLLNARARAGACARCPWLGQSPSPPPSRLPIRSAGKRSGAEGVTDASTLAETPAAQVSQSRAPVRALTAPPGGWRRCPLVRGARWRLSSLLLLLPVHLCRWRSRARRQHHWDWAEPRRGRLGRVATWRDPGRPLPRSLPAMAGQAVLPCPGQQPGPVGCA